MTADCIVAEAAAELFERRVLLTVLDEIEAVVGIGKAVNTAVFFPYVLARRIGELCRRRLSDASRAFNRHKVIENFFGVGVVVSC